MVGVLVPLDNCTNNCSVVSIKLSSLIVIVTSLISLFVPEKETVFEVET